MGIVQVAQRAEDLERAAGFYSDLLKLQPAALFEPPGLVFFVVDGVRLLLERGAPSSLIYFAVPDVRRRIEELRSGGVEIVGEPASIFRHEDAGLGPAGTDEWMAFVRDTEGNTVGLVSRYGCL
jgi:methylmalonyl-CoA/ethylmalonyl-CoA epimerase